MEHPSIKQSRLFSIREDESGIISNYSASSIIVSKNKSTILVSINTFYVGNFFTELCLPLLHSGCIMTTKSYDSIENEVTFKFQTNFKELQQALNDTGFIAYNTTRHLLEILNHIL